MIKVLPPVVNGVLNEPFTLPTMILVALVYVAFNLPLAPP